MAAQARLLILVAATAAALGGCIREQAEEVFARQNAAVAAIATIGQAAPAAGPARAADPALEDVEAQLTRACDALNDAAARRMSGAEAEEGFELDILLSLDECASRTEEAERAIRVAAPALALEMFGEPGPEPAPPFTH